MRLTSSPRAKRNLGHSGEANLNILGGAMPWFLWDLRASIFPSGINMLTFACFAVYCVLDPLNSLFDSTKRVDRSMHFHFQVQALLISDNSTLE